MTIFLTPVWLLLMQNPEWIPKGFQFIRVSEEINIPIFFQLLILELAIDGLKLAAINTPSNLTTPLSVIAAIVVGEFAVKSGWFNSETMLYMAFVAMANYMQADYELGYALKFMRLLLLVLDGHPKSVGPALRLRSGLRFPCDKPDDFRRELPCAAASLQWETVHQAVFPKEAHILLRLSA